MDLFSESFYLENINHKTTYKIHFFIFFNNFEYKVVSPFYNWIQPKNYFLGYGYYDKEKKIIYLESIIPHFSNYNVLLFNSFLIDAKIIGLTKNKITLLYNTFENKIIDHFLNNNFIALNTVLNFSDEKLLIIKKKWEEIKTYIDLHLELKKCFLSASSIKKVYKTYKEKSIDVIKNNPFDMIFQLGFGFKTVDKIAKECGFCPTDKKRIEGAIFFTFLEKKKLGNSCIIDTVLLDEVFKIAVNDQCKEDDIKITVSQMIATGKIIPIKNFYSLKEDYIIEKKIYDFFFNNNKKIELKNHFEPINKYISNEQKDAILGALKNKYSIITGPAGTGKSTIINEIYFYQNKYNKKIIVLTPTGRASQRILEISPHLIAMTIHKFFIMHKLYFFKNGYESSSIFFDYDHIIIDESSMIDTELLAFLLKHVKKNTQITFLGDNNQLPPIGVGEPFHIMIEKKSIPVFLLNHIFRQKEGGKLLIIAQQISSGIFPKITKNNEIEFINSTKDTIINKLYELIDIYYDIKKKELSFLGITFLNRGNVGTIKLNKIIQEYIQKKYSPHINKIINKFYLHDSIVVTKNNYKLNIRNGEIGKVIGGDDSFVTILFNNQKEITFSFQEADILDLAYVINIYKSQGSEFNFIIIFLFIEQYILLHKKALYTALTRTKKKAIIIGEKKAMYCAIHNKNIEKRDTILEKLYLNNIN